jgi:ATP-dependent RNA helicase DeaD
MNSFADLKLDADLLERLGELGYCQPTAFQAESIPAIARGTAGVGVASAGCGKTLAYALGLAGRLDAGDPDLQALVLRPTDDGAAATADTMNQLLGVRGLSVSALGSRSRAAAQIAVASPDAALAALEHSTIKLDAVKTLVVDGVSAMLELGAEEALEALTAQIPKAAQRIVLSARLTPDVQGWIDRHARRARQYTYSPPEPKLMADANVEFWPVPRNQWLPALMSVLAGRAAAGDMIVSLHCRRAAEAEALTDQLRVRGMAFASAPEEPGIWVESGFPGASPPGSLSISWGVPPDYVSFHARVADADRALVFLEPRELPHLQHLAETAAARLTALRSEPPPEAARSAQLTRDQLREAASERDLEPYMLLIAPLLQEFTPSQVAAAAAALLRERAPDTPEEALPAWTRLYFNVGRKDGVRPADLVGAITGETAIGGDSIGRIEIRDTHTSVEVAATVAEKVIKELATATIRGRPANVRVFRE